MSKKIKLSQICKSVDDILDHHKNSLKINKNINCNYENTNSLDKFDNSAVTVITEILPIIIVQSFLYHNLDKPTSILPQHQRNAVDAEFITVIKNMANNMPNKYVDYLMTLIRRFKLINLTKDQYATRKFIMFNDSSREHLAPFNVIKVPDIPKKNILLKLSGLKSEHYRIGIAIFDEEYIINIKIVNMVNKKTRNK